MILLDTHIWLWWTSAPDRLSAAQREALEREAALAVSVISCWEVAKLVENGRLTLDRPVETWIAGALAAGRIAAWPLTVEIAIASTRLPGTFHRDPADQIIVATAREHRVRLATSDQKMLAYPHVETVA